MNLIQIQDELKSLPIQVIMSYANGQNPEVPPYMALGELNRRKTSEQRRAEPPTQSVKEKLESQFQAPQMPQGMPQAPQGMPQGMPQGPQGIAQLPAAQMAQQAAPQAAPQAPGMAGGGLAELPVRDDMFHYAPGGIVAFASGKIVRGPGGEMIPEDDRAGEAEAAAQFKASQQSPAQVAPQGMASAPPVISHPYQPSLSGLASLKAPAAGILSRAITGEMEEPMPKDPEVIRKEILDKNPELATLVNKIPGSELASLSTKLKAQNEAGKAQFKEGQGRMGLAGLANALIAAGEATRGQKGSGFGEAMGGFGKSYSKFTEEDVKRIQAQQALERQQEIEVGKLDADIEALRQAYATAQIERRFTDAANYQKAIAERVARKNTLQINAAEKGLSLIGQEEQMKQTGAFQQSELQLRREANQQSAAHASNMLTLEGKKLDELIANHASQRDIERQRLKFQEATKNSQLLLDRERLDALIESRPTADQKIAARIEANLNKPGSDFAEVTKRIASLSAEELDSPVGKYYREIRDKYREQAYKQAGLTPDKPITLPTFESFQPKPVVEPGFLDRLGTLFGGGSSAPAPKVIKLD